jgi:RNA polymerase sigma-70 factor (ECF subfamily)
MAVEQDNKLIRRIAEGDAEAMRDLYRRHGRTVYGIAIAVCGDASIAEEVAQDVFLRVWKRADTYQPDKAKVVTWLARIARNVSIDALRRASARPGQAQDSEAALEVFLDPRAVEPGDSAQVAAMRLRVRAAVAALPPELMRVLSLGFFRGLTHQEIAEQLGHPLGTVKTRMRDALQRLRESLSEEKP